MSFRFRWRLALAFCVVLVVAVVLVLPSVDLPWTELPQIEFALSIFCVLVGFVRLDGYSVRAFLKGISLRSHHHIVRDLIAIRFHPALLMPVLLNTR
jgi:hypothetical protein